jgi:peptidylprolyl isomerase
MRPEIVVFSLVIIALVASGYMAVTGGFVGIFGDDGMSVAVFDTSMGTFRIELFEDSMPITTGNFIKLANDGFYDGVIFHRVIDGFMIQGGDPDGTGSGGPGYTIDDEFVEDEGLSNVRGTISMANTGQPNSGGSQFFINVVDNTNLDWDKPPSTSKHPVFGKVVTGMNVVDAIAKVTVGPGARPVEDVVINKLTIE